MQQRFLDDDDLKQSFNVNNQADKPHHKHNIKQNVNINNNVKEQRCKKEKGRNLCLYSSLEFGELRQLKVSDILSDSSGSELDFNNIDYTKIEKKYYTNIYLLTKWSKHIRSLFRNYELPKHSKKMADGTLCMGIPASSKAIMEVLSAVNIENDEMKADHLGNVKWIRFMNLIEVFNIANYLKIQDLINKCIKVIENTLPRKDNSHDQQTSHNEQFMCNQTSSEGKNQWKFDISFVNCKNLGKKVVKERAISLLELIEYLEDRSKEFEWCHEKFKHDEYIHSLLLAFLCIDHHHVNIKEKMELFNKYIQYNGIAYKLYMNFAMMSLGNNAPKYLKL